MGRAAGTNFELPASRLRREAGIPYSRYILPYFYPLLGISRTGKTPYLCICIEPFLKDLKGSKGLVLQGLYFWLLVKKCIFVPPKKKNTMHLLGKYKPADSMSDLVTEHYRMLLVMSRFGISLGFGDKTIEEVCRDSQVDLQTFLTVVNLLLDDDNNAGYSSPPVSVESLLVYLHNAHEYFLQFRLPAIREKLKTVLGNKKSHLSTAILSYFDEYVAEVQKHMMYEENTVFPYVRALLRGQRNIGYTIDIFSKQHNQVEARLKEFKNIIIKYYPAKSTNELNSALFDIFNCEHDLASHNAIEDHLFVPAIAALERKKEKKP
jgi:regulator of cell morphogenesis and NO signaling